MKTMKCFAVATVALAALTEVASAHYIFEYLTANGAKGALFQNIRPVPNNSPVTDLASSTLRCNVNGGSGSGTTTVAVAAGSSVSFTADQAFYTGPTSFYMTKVDSAASADGSSDWFKIKEIGPTFSGGSASWDLSTTYSATIPSQLPAGDYLLRIEQLAIHNPSAVPQFYISCAQIKVTGGGSGKASPTVKIPGHIKSTDPGYTANIYSNFNSYTVPGPKVATY
ncbi:glycoside hydrolase family 61 [Pyrenophora seminiperda CCB06]|uniref:AA9 family lytic polysaccharide monooxygenase n=1 Tax=Pyrenophora seminiperda CCB06 TaxID=1302712 RepID=A0A3M7MGV7_9PLEO|nr:glycoside hydrolase family 61 [Pyrenophora seminiperda CCB06]